MSQATPPIAFGGPSLADVPASWLERLELRPPAQRGDLERLLERPPGRVILLDGLFGSRMAVAPTECRRLLERGFSLYGASSMGALRAAELWSCGMIGIGEIYTLLRADVIRSDAELAVGYHPDSHEELTVSLVHLRAVLFVPTPGWDPGWPAAAFELARRCYWLERSPAALQQRWRRSGLPGSFVDTVVARLEDPAMHPKRRDGHLAVKLVLGEGWAPRAQSE